MKQQILILGFTLCSFCVFSQENSPVYTVEKGEMVKTIPEYTETLSAPRCDEMLESFKHDSIRASSNLDIANQDYKNAIQAIEEYRKVYAKLKK